METFHDHNRIIARGGRQTLNGRLIKLLAKQELVEALKGNVRFDNGRDHIRQHRQRESHNVEEC